MSHKRSLAGLARRMQKDKNYLNSMYGCDFRFQIKRYDVSDSFSIKQIKQVTNFSSQPYYRSLRKAEGNCAYCGAKNNLDVHHIDKNRQNNQESNLIVLCHSCHMGVHKEMRLTNV